MSGETVLIVGNYRPTLAVIRSLVGRGRRVIVGRAAAEPHTEGSAGAEYARGVAEVWPHPAIEQDREGFLGSLVSFLSSRPDIGMVFPVSETAVLTLARARDRLPSGCRLAAAEPALIELCIDKQAMHGIAEQAGLRLPETRTVRDLEAVRQAASDIGYPCVLKPLAPRDRLLGRKAMICRSANELEREMPAWPSEHERILVQQRADGPRHNIYFAAEKGRILDRIEVIIGRTDTIDGTGLAVEGRTIPASPGLDAQLARLLAHLGYTGVGCAQFLVRKGETDGTFLELGPRLGANFAVVNWCGLDLANAVIDLALGQTARFSTPPNRDRDNASYAWTYGDLCGLASAVRYRNAGGREAVSWAWRLLASAVRADMHLTWSWRDPRPTLVTYGRGIAFCFGKAARRLAAALALPGKADGSPRSAGRRGRR
jgi:predicted ATP-grasp superfamily ATP-dependent carboligase